MSEKIKAIRGSKNRTEEVKQWLIKQGAKDFNDCSFVNQNNLYFVIDGVVNVVSTEVEILFDVEELEPKNEYKFKPFDKVLVRDYKSPWHCDLFSYKSNTGYYPYHCTSNTGWTECIHYEGNEDKVGKVTD